MRKSVWLALVMVMILPMVFFTMSCAKKVVEQQPATTPQPEVKQGPTAAEQQAAEQRMREERLRAEAAAREAAREAFVNQDIHFDFDSSSLAPEAQNILNDKAAYLRSNSDVNVMIEGNTDERGTDAYNMALGERRAQAAKDYLVNLGINAKRLDTISYGEERPIAQGHTEEAWAKNRRDHFSIK